MQRDSLFKAVAAPWANTTYSLTWNVYAFHEKSDIKLIQTKINKETFSLLKAVVAYWSETTFPKTRNFLCFL